MQINNTKIGKDKTAVLKDGNEIAFGSPHPQPGDIEDYRSLFIPVLTFTRVTRLQDLFIDILLLIPRRVAFTLTMILATSSVRAHLRQL